MKKLKKLVSAILTLSMMIGTFATGTVLADTTNNERPVRTLTMDTRSYFMSPNNRYTFRAKVSGDGISQNDVKVRSSRDHIAQVQRLGNTDTYQITGLQSGVTFIIAEIGNTHASIKVTVEPGIKQYGDACRAVSVIPYTDSNPTEEKIKPSVPKTDTNQQVRTLMLDTRSYFMSPNNIYTFRAKVTGPDVYQKDVKVRSSRDHIASVQRIGTSDLYKITGLRPGVTFVIAEIGNTHASIKVTVEQGIKQHGEACRAISIISNSTPTEVPVTPTPENPTIPVTPVPTIPSEKPDAPIDVDVKPTHKFKVYLSPSSQFANLYVNGGTEEQYMRLVAEAMIPYLNYYDMDYVLAEPKKSLPTSQWPALLTYRAREAAATNSDIYFAIHSNAFRSGANRGTLILYYTKSQLSKNLADCIKNNYIYPDPSKVKYYTNDSLADMHNPSMPTCLIETAYHDNVDDANWIKNNIDAIARSLVLGIKEYKEKYYDTDLTNSPEVSIVPSLDPTVSNGNIETNEETTN